MVVPGGQNGLLVLTSPVGQLVQRFKAVLPSVLQTTDKLVYVHLLPGVVGWPPQRHHIIPSVSTWSNIIGRIYIHSSSVHPNVDLRVLLNGVKANLNPINIKIHRSIDHVFFEHKLDIKVVQGYMSNCLNTEQQAKQIYLPPIEGIEDEVIETKAEDDIVYDKVCVGGTFDRLHTGHKMLLTEAILRCSKSLTVGVTDESMLKNKTLMELIQSTSKRMEEVDHFIKDQDPYLERNVVSISDPYGPAITDPDLKLIVGSEDTRRGCEKVNEARAKINMEPLVVHILPVIKDSYKQDKLEEAKISSRSLRMRLLGTELIPPTKIWNKSVGPYVIGLTGGSGSGKSSIAKYLAENYDNVGVVDCDKLAHMAYLKGTDCFKKIIEAFGSDIIDPISGEIDRKVLGAKVFGDPKSRRKLEELVWPKIMALADVEIKDHFTRGKNVVILDAAVLLLAEWDKFCHQVWASIVPKDVALQRIVERGKSPEQAAQVLESQLYNKELISKANVVFCTLWDYSYTQGQIVKAMNGLQKHLK